MLVEFITAQFRRNKMNKYLKNLNRIEFVVTLACSGKCKHCSQGEHKSSVSIDKNTAVSAVEKISAGYNIESVMTFGGEPLLFPETVCEIHKAARKMNIPKRQLITNGYFSKDADKIKLVAQRLAESGVNEILLSVDAFHQETIPLEIVKAFAQEVKKTNIILKLQPAWLQSPDTDNIYNNKTKELLAEFEDIEIGEGNVVFPSGNALRYLSEYFDLSEKPKNPYDEDPKDIRAICFSANGDILGSNIYEKDICKILSDYKPANIFLRKIKK